MEDKHDHPHGDKASTGQHVTTPNVAPASSNLSQSTDNTTQSELRETGRTNGSMPVKDDARANDAARATDRPSEAPTLPQLLNDTPTTSRLTSDLMPSDGEDEGPAQSFPRSTSPVSAAPHVNNAVYQNLGEEGVCQMHRFWLYETTSRYYLVGGDVAERKFRILKIDRTADDGDLSIAEDDIVYTKKEMNQLLDTVDDGNKASGGMKLKCNTWGLLGFVRFTGAFYMLLVTKRSPVAVIGGHYVYQIDGTELVSLTVSSFRSKMDRDPEEARFVGILNNLDLSRSFYFSYSYDVTRTLQHNILRERQALQRDQAHPPSRDPNSMFVWNHHLLEPASTALKKVYDWCSPIVHGFVDQASKQPQFLTASFH